MSREYVAPIEGVSPEQLREAVTSFLAFAANNGHDLGHEVPYRYGDSLTKHSNEKELISQWLEFLAENYPPELQESGEGSLIVDLNSGLEVMSPLIDKSFYPESFAPHLRQVKDLSLRDWIVAATQVQQTVLGCIALWWPGVPHPESWVLPMDTYLVDGGIKDRVGAEGYEWVRLTLSNVKLPALTGGLSISERLVLVQEAIANNEPLPRKELAEMPDSPELLWRDLQEQLVSVPGETPVRVQFEAGGSFYVGRAEARASGLQRAVTGTPFIVLRVAKGPIELLTGPAWD